MLAGFFKSFTRGFFHLFYEMEIEGLEHVPREGAVIIAPNHVNYFDAPMLMAFLPRPIYFVAASTAFKIPVWASLMRVYGTIPVERGKADASAIKASLGVLAKGNVLGIFPEGTFTEDGHTVSAKQGTAHMAVKSGAPIIPVTITGAFHSWPRLGPHKRSLPRPWMIRIKFHEPIRIAPEDLERRQRDKAFSEALTARVMEAVNRTLEPSLRAEAKIDRLVAGPAPRVRLYELFPIFLSVAAALMMGLRTRWFTDPDTSASALKFLWSFLGTGVAYYVYLAWDVRRPRQNAFTRALRSYAPFLFLLLYYPLLVQGIPMMAEVRDGAPGAYPQWMAGLPAPWKWSLVDWFAVSYFTVIPYVLLSLRHYHFHKFLLFQKFARGLLLSLYAGLLTILFAPSVGGWFPLAIPSSALGLMAPWVTQSGLSRLVVASFPTVIVTLTVFCSVFDLLHHRTTFYVLLFPVVSAVASAVLLRGYPLAAVAANVLLVLVVMVYMRLFPMTAHDGRAI